MFANFASYTQRPEMSAGLGGVSLEQRPQRWDGVSITPSQVIPSRVISPPSFDDIDYTGQCVAYGEKQLAHAVPSVSQPGDSTAAHVGTALGRIRLSVAPVQYPSSVADLPSWSGRRTQRQPPHRNQQTNVPTTQLPLYSNEPSINESTTQLPSYSSQQYLAASATGVDPAVHLYLASLGEHQNSNRLNGTPASPTVHHRQTFVPPVRNQGFIPMQAIRSGRGFNVSPQTPATNGRFSVRYQGMHTDGNASAEHLRPEQNASLWITNLPPDVTTHELLGQIRNIGRVWASVIHRPEATKYSQAAAKIIFFSPAAAQHLLQLSLLQGFIVRGCRAKVTQNRIKTPETHPRQGNDSRVLIITGHKSFVNRTTLTAYFEQKFEFQLDEVKELLSRGGRAVVEFKFGSYRCQSQMGKMSLEIEMPAGFEQAEFGEDPCEFGETSSSMEIALQRI